LRATTFPEQKRFVDHMLQIDAENTWTISIATPPPQLVVIKNGFRNVPRNALAGWLYVNPANAGLELYYEQEPHDSPGAIAEAEQSIVHATPRPGSPDEQAAARATVPARIVGAILRWGFV